jgi:LCP family protein required for cell wall assembly
MSTRAARGVPAPRRSGRRGDRAQSWSRRVHPLRRELLACLLIILATTVAISVAVIGVVSTIAGDLALGGKPISSTELTAASAGAAQTIMVIGDDHIGPTTSYQTGAEQDLNGVHLLHADTFMLVRMDPSQNQTSILSIPRDLLVSFHWKGQYYPDQKFNATYSLGGVNLALQVAKATLPGITINHVIDFNFSAFLGLVDAIGCVYIDVDHRYYHPPGGSYQPINVQPGYQRLCGENALAYVRYRHTDSDFVRVARQQDFIRQAKEQLGVWGFLSKYDKLAKAFGRAVGTDIRGDSEVSQLLELAAFSLSRPVRQVPFNVANADYNVVTPNGTIESAVQSTPQLIGQSVDNFLYEHPKASVPGVVASAPSAGHTAAPVHHHHHHHHTATVGPGHDDLYALTAGISQQALAISPDVSFPVELPSVQTGPASLDNVHAFSIRDEQDHLHFGYRVDWSTGDVGDYYGIEGMSWLNPPLFANPSATSTIDGRTYMFVDDGSSFHDIGWREHGALYWVSNSLQETLTNAQMLAIAESAQPIAAG